MKPARILCVLTFVLVGLFCGTDAWAQGGSGELTGIVFDPAQAVVAGAKVELSNSATGAVRSDVTTSSGSYRFVALPIVGTYTLKVEATGFKTFIIGHIVITVGTVVTQDVHLELGPVTQTVTVEAGVQLVQPTESAVSELVNQRVWQSLPLETRSQNEFILLLPGVVASAEAGAFQRGAAVDGARTGSGNFLVEGYDNNDQGLAGGGALVGPGGANTTISPDAIQEYRVIEHLPPAEYGKTGGFVTDTVLKSGTNSWHGSAFEYNRVQALAANHFFSNRGGVKDSLVRNQFGGSLGGPIAHDKFFAFGSVEFHRLRTGSPVTATSTTQQFLDFVNTGAFARFMESDPAGLCVQATGSTCPGAFSRASTLGPIFSNLLATQPFPLGTRNFSNIGASAFTSSGFAGIVPSDLRYPVPIYGDATVINTSQLNQARYTAKVDYKLSKDQFSVAFLYDNADAVSKFDGADTTLGPSLPNHGRAMNAGITWTRNFTPTVVNQFRASWVRHTGDFPGDPKAFAAGIPSIVTAIDPLAVGFGNASNLPQFFSENGFTFRDDLSFVKGKHSFKAGGSYTRTRNKSSFQADFFGLFEPYGVEDLVTDMKFGDLADQALFGGPAFGSWFAAEASLDPTTKKRPEYYRGFRANEMAAYFQDDWRVTRRLTINVGLRYDYFGPPHNFRPGLDSNFYFGNPVTPIVSTSTNPFFPRTSPDNARVATATFQQRDHEVWNKDTNNFAPRFGFAWDAFGTQRVIVRGGYGIGYDRMYNNIFENIRFNPPFFCFCNFGAFLNGVPGGAISTPGVYTVPFTSLSAFTNPAILPVLPKSSPRHIDQNILTAYYQQMFFGVQWEFARGFALETNYIGTLGRKLLGIQNINTFDGRVACVRGGGPNPDGTYPLTTPCGAAGFRNGFSTTRINTTINSDNFRTNLFASNYHSLQVTLKKRFASGLQFNANYTFSKALDTLSDVFLNKQGLSPSDSQNIRNDYGPADFNLKHRFTTNFYYELPLFRGNRWLGGWAASGIVVVQGGFPFSVVDSTYDANKNGTFTDRVSFTGSGGITSAITHAKSPADQYLTSGVFADTKCPASVNLGLWCNGGTGRNALTGPGYTNVDFGLSKKFKFTESASLTFQANFFNLFNHPNFLRPNNDISNTGAFGRSRSTFDPRITQLSLRLDF